MNDDHADESRDGDAGASPPPDESSVQTKSCQARSASWRSWAFVLCLASIAGAAAWLGGERAHQLFKPSEESSSQRFDFRALNRELSLSGTRNAAVAFGLLGACLGLALSLTPGSSRRSTVRRLGSSLLGLLAGGTAGVAGSYLVIPFHYEYKDPSGTEIGQSVLTHGMIWGLVGLGAGVAYGISRSRPTRLTVFRSAQGGLIGALIGTVLYELIGGLAFPLARTTDAISASAWTRLLACMAIALGTAVGILMSQPPESEPS
jgi:hypothetical protein